jgi:hypothetical protein
VQRATSHLKDLWDHVDYKPYIYMYIWYIYIYICISLIDSIIYVI